MELEYAYHDMQPQAAAAKAAIQTVEGFGEFIGA